MNVMVTGATGFIGLHLAERLVSDGFSVRCLVRSKERAKFLEGFGVSVSQGDVTKKESLKDALRDTDAVFHLAAVRGEKNIPESVYWDVNIKGTKNMLEASVENDVKRFVYCSTVGVMGWPEKLPADERTPPRPKGIYHTTKYEGEKLSMDFHNKENLPTTIVRPGITYGERDVSGMVFKLTRLMKNGRFLTMGSGKNFLHLVYVKNLVEGLLLCLKNESAAGQTYILADERPITLNELVGTISDSLGKSPPKIHVPLTAARLFGKITGPLRALNIEPPVTETKVDILTKNRYYDISKAKRELGYGPEITTADGLGITIDWYKKNGCL